MMREPIRFIRQGCLDAVKATITRLAHQPVETQATSGALSPGGVPADGCGIRRESPSCSLAGSLM